MKKSIAIICSGGPVTGIDNVISTFAKTFLEDGYDEKRFLTGINLRLYNNGTIYKN